MASPSPFHVELIISSARDLKDVFWLRRRLNPYAIVWVDPSSKCFTKVDEDGDTCPFWEETFVFSLSSPIEESIIFINIAHANSDRGTKTWIGSARVKLRKIFNAVGFGKWMDRSLKLKRRSGLCKGVVDVKINVRQNYYCPLSLSYYTPSPPQMLQISITSHFSLLEIAEATRNYDPGLMIGEGEYGSVYRGFLRNTPVAIRFLRPGNTQGPSEFQQEVDILSRIRHPNLVTLIGACTEACSLIYEYLPNGSLEDRLVCKDNSPPLPWQRRICIAVEVCSALIFLHSNKPVGIMHGDLKLANILLDANMVSKLSDFGISRLSIDTTMSASIAIPKGTFGYIDPEFLAIGKLTTKSDIYSFGKILLRLLTGKPAIGLEHEVRQALDKGKLSMILDQTAGDWPFVHAKQLAELALRCCDMNSRTRPDLNSEVWRVLEQMKALSGGSSSFNLLSDEHLNIPSHFICPIYQEIMRDPHMAADGFTYEVEALRAWLDNGHDTSPMTNMKLLHFDLIPNHSLRSAIEEWLLMH